MGYFEAFIGVNFWTALFVLLNTLVIFFVARKFLFGPVMKIIADRQQEIDGMYAAANDAQQQAEAMQGQEILKLMGTADEKMKGILNWVFGGSNDFHKLLEGINLLAVAENGERVVTNLFEALEPVLVEGAKLCAATQAKAKRNAQR